MRHDINSTCCCICIPIPYPKLKVDFRKSWYQKNIFIFVHYLQVLSLIKKTFNIWILKPCIKDNLRQQTNMMNITSNIKMTTALRPLFSYGREFVWNQFWYILIITAICINKDLWHCNAEVAGCTSGQCLGVSISGSGLRLLHPTSNQLPRDSRPNHHPPSGLWWGQSAV